MNEIENTINGIKNAVNGFLVRFNGNDGNINKYQDTRNVNYAQVQQKAQPQSNNIKFSDMGSRHTRLSPVVYNSNPTVNGIKFNSD